MGGERIGAAEVLAAFEGLKLAGRLGVAEAALLVEEDPLYGARVAAFVVLEKRDPTRDSSAPTRAELVAALGERLGSHKVPREYYSVDSLPRTPNGKISREGLKALKSLGLLLRS